MTYVWAAYTVVWVLVFGYTLLLGQRQRQLQRDLEALRQAVDRRSKA